MSTKGCCHQFITNRDSQIGVWWRRKLLSANRSIFTQHGCENNTAVRRPWGQATFWLGSSCSALCWSALLLWWHFGVSAQLGKYSLQSLVERESRPIGATRVLTHKDIKSLPLVPDWSVLIQRRTPNLHCWIGPIGTVLTGENGVAVIGQWRSQWGYSCATPIGWGKSQS